MDQNRLCLRIIKVIRDSLLVRHRFLARAFNALSPAPWPEASSGDISPDSYVSQTGYGTDGRFFYYDPASLMTDTLNETGDTELVWLHSCLHCLFLHPFIRMGIEDPSLWDAACDIHIAYIMEKLVPGTGVPGLSPDIPNNSAQSIYRYLYKRKSEGDLSPEYEQDLARRFRVDDHHLWMSKALCDDAAENGKRNDTEGPDPYSVTSGKERISAGHPAPTEPRREAAVSALEKECSDKWKQIAGRVLMEYRIGARRDGRGNGEGDFEESLEGISRRKRTFDEFLKRFAVTRERLVTDPDAFDYGYYNYGISLYRDMPIIEPPEYKEAPTVRTFVIAIDTSSSCDDELVKRFIDEAFGILSGTYFDMNRLCVHILQCDAGLRSDTPIESREDLERFTVGLTVKGRGGTDFRPVFDAVDKMRKEGSLPGLEGLIYFTDGDGVYPSKPPDYRTAFVLAGDEGRIRVPSWAMYTEFESV